MPNKTEQPHGLTSVKNTDKTRLNRTALLDPISNVKVIIMEVKDGGDI